MINPSNDLNHNSCIETSNEHILEPLKSKHLLEIKFPEIKFPPNNNYNVSINFINVFFKFILLIQF